MVIEVGDPLGQSWEAVDALVDTGSTYTWISRQLLGRLGVRPQFQREFQTADGRVIERDMAITTVRWNGEVMPTLVVFGGEGDAMLLGAYTLGGFALAPDSVNRRLVRVRGLAMGIVSNGWQALPHPSVDMSTSMCSDGCEVVKVRRGQAGQGCRGGPGVFSHPLSRRSFATRDPVGHGASSRRVGTR